MMYNYTDDYYFITYADIDTKPIPLLGPDEDTNNVNFISEDVTSNGRRPLIFINASAVVNPDFKFPKNPPDIMFFGSNIAVDEKIYKKLVELEIPNLIIQPSIYIDEKEIWHKNYWFLTFVNKIDCWSRKYSKYDPVPLGVNKDLFSIYNYKLDDDILDNMPLTNRLLFKMGCDISGIILVHKSLSAVFLTKNNNGVALVPVKDYGVSFFH